MGCVNATNTRQVVTVQVTFQDTVSQFPVPAFESDFRRSIETRHPTLKVQPWVLVDATSNAEIRNQDEYQRFCAALKGRSLGRVTVVLGGSGSFHPDSPLHSVSKAVCALRTAYGTVCTGVLVSTSLVLFPSALRERVFGYSCVFTADKRSVSIPMRKGGLHALDDCETVAVELDLTKEEHREAVQAISPIPVKRIEKELKKGDKAVCLHYDAKADVLREWRCEVEEETSSHIAVAGQLPDGSYGAPLFLPSGSLIGLMLSTRSPHSEVFLRSDRLLRALQSLLPQSSPKPPPVAPESVALEVSRNDEGSYSIGLEDIPMSPQRRGQVQSSQPAIDASSPQFSFDDGDVPPMPMNHQVPILPKTETMPYAHLLQSVGTGTELWRLAKAEFSMRKDATTVELPRRCSSVDTQIGVVISGGEDSFGRKLWVWGADGVKEVGTMRFSHSRHTSIQLASSVLIISGDSTEEVERFDLPSLSLHPSQPLPKQRFNAAVCAIGQSALFLAGGYIGHQGKPSRSILEYRLHSDAWLKVSFKLTAPMAALGVCFISPKSLLVIGGKNAQGSASAEAYIVDMQTGLKVASLHLPEPATFARTQAVRDGDSFLVFSDQTHQFEYDVRRQRFYLLSVSSA